jgi:hypothetical protein
MARTLLGLIHIVLSDGVNRRRGLHGLLLRPVPDKASERNAAFQGRGMVSLRLRRKRGQPSGLARVNLRLPQCPSEVDDKVPSDKVLIYNGLIRLMLGVYPRPAHIL